MKIRSVLISAVAFVALFVPGFSQSTPDKPVYLDPSQPLEKRVADLVSRMTLEEKVSQMQNHAAAIPRLQVPDYDWWSEALHGVARAGYATVFPQAIGLAATWDTGLEQKIGDTVSTEARAKFNAAQAEDDHSIYRGLDFWSPNINIFRDPRWGRGQETYGEDPYLTGQMGAAFIKGMQGDNPKIFKTIATAKHYAVHSGPESTRHSVNIDPSPHDVEDTYLPAFRMAMVDAKADSIMCAYNSVNGSPACANQDLLVKRLRSDWKFTGYVVSDCGAISDFFSENGHHFSSDAAHASAAAVKAGDDLSCGTEYAALVDAVHQGLIDEAAINQAVTRLFTARFKLGLFDPQGSNAYSQITASENATPAHAEVALQAAHESMVLLKNDNNTLPLASSVKTIAVIGPNAESLTSLEGNYNGVPMHPVTPLAGLQAKFADKGPKVLFSQGSPLVAELPVIVPSSVFSDKDGHPGLAAEYFANPDFSGTATTEHDAHIDFDWNRVVPVPVQGAKGFSVRWTGNFQPLAPGDVTFTVDHANCEPHCASTYSYSVSFDGKEVASDASNDPHDPGRPLKFTVHFDDAKPHPFKMEYSRSGSDYGAGIRLKWKPDVEQLRQQAIQTANQADVVVAFVGLSPEVEGEEMPVHIPGFSGGDRTDIALPEVQRDLLDALASTNKPLVVVLLNGSALAVDWAQQHAAAILEAWYPGQAGGTAIADVLAGTVNPAGRLPVTFYQSVDQLPAFDNYTMEGRTYRYFRQKPLYGFGYGLSYSKFAYKNLKLSAVKLNAGAPLHVTVDVENTSAVAGDEVAELYITPPDGPGNPNHWLAGFKRVHIEPHQVAHVAFDLDARGLSMVDAQGQRAVTAGDYKVFVGGAQPGDTTTGLEQKLTITGMQKVDEAVGPSAPSIRIVRK
ncbi:glycoside hydrolase family 3 C-terminal domain-containing protein [Alloacidobacterium sp.]|uniref:glycoside hydrolase family 3 C-terminal domain-containing protein n=1 Tax=Alloacidobacterium sp. TaxID=2951999 RepID=UPI002D685BA2|nr:glycoside hydrolase family 3 C-terminal domain-containing protein [Alloacidobacterium sp.]HYK37836.1 glycoside hydrolase family 3 C-terminal domain-containing protein [Alloacidobacterium sp.]